MNSDFETRNVNLRDSQLLSTRDDLRCDPMVHIGCEVRSAHDMVACVGNIWEYSIDHYQSHITLLWIKIIMLCICWSHMMKEIQSSALNFHNFCISTPIFETWNANLCDSWSLTQRGNLPCAPTVDISCEVIIAHDKAACVVMFLRIFL